MRLTRDRVVKIRPIRTDKDHAGALHRIEALMDAEPGTAAADELDVLATLVEAYEDRHFPIDEPDPIEAIRFRMDQSGLTRRDLERLHRAARPRFGSAQSSAAVIAADDPRAAPGTWDSPRKPDRSGQLICRMTWGR